METHRVGSEKCTARKKCLRDAHVPRGSLHYIDSGREGEASRGCLGLQMPSPASWLERLYEAGLPHFCLSVWRRGLEGANLRAAGLEQEAPTSACWSVSSPCKVPVYWLMLRLSFTLG